MVLTGSHFGQRREADTVERFPAFADRIVHAFGERRHAALGTIARFGSGDDLVFQNFLFLSLCKDFLQCAQGRRKRLR